MKKLVIISFALFTLTLLTSAIGESATKSKYNLTCQNNPDGSLNCVPLNPPPTTTKSSALSQGETEFIGIIFFGGLLVAALFAFYVAFEPPSRGPCR